MRLIRLEAKNACQFCDLRLDFSKGMTALTGANGCGKSSVLRLVAFALTGTVDGTWGSQSNLQQDGMPVPGYVEIEVDDFTIRRYFKDSTKNPDRLVLPDEVVERRQAVNLRLEELFGIPLSVLFSLVWARQEALDWLLCSQSAFVSSFLASLLQLDLLQKIRVQLQAADRLLYDLPDRTVELARLSDQLTQTEEELRRTDSALEDAVVVRTALTDLQATAPRTLESYTQWSAEKRRLEGRLAWAGSGALKDAREYVAVFEAHRRRCDCLRARQARVLHLQDACQALVNTLSGKVRDAEAQLQELRRIAEAQRQGRCAFCGAPLASSEEYLEKVLAKFPEKSLSKAEEAVKLGLASLREEQMRLASKVDRAVSCKEKLGAAICAEETVLRNMRPTFGKLKKLLEASHETPELLQKFLSEHAAKPHQTEEQEEEFRRQDSELSACALQCASLSASKQQMETYREHLASEIHEKTQEQAEHLRNSRAHWLLAELRDCFGPGRVQAAYAAEQIRFFNSKLASFMEKTDLPFTVSLDEQAHVFVYKTADGFLHPAGHLSGAQKKIVAMLVQLCLLELSGCRLHLLMLDEVDASLDSENRHMLADLFRRLSGIGNALIVTREEETINSCENQIKLEEVAR